MLVLCLLETRTLRICGPLPTFSEPGLEGNRYVHLVSPQFDVGDYNLVRIGGIVTAFKFYSRSALLPVFYAMMRLVGIGMNAKQHR